ncbi:MAG: hypothetical protein D3923_10445 [Candidatus Electrothrix sp. AR3]|nr:hypothetical protein [Candidatus Electrothrix sp. AR3]
MKKFKRIIKLEQGRKNKLSASIGGPKPDNMRRIRNGKLFSQTVAAATLEGRLLLRDAGVSRIACIIRQV